MQIQQVKLALRWAQKEGNSAANAKAGLTLGCGQPVLKVKKQGKLPAQSQ